MVATDGQSAANGERAKPVNARGAARIGWFVWALSLTLLATDAVLQFLNSSTPDAGARDQVLFDIGFLLLSMALATVGSLIVSHQSANPIGWLFCVLGLSLPLSSAGEEYALYALETRPDTLPGGEMVAWAAGWFGGPILFAMVAFVLLLFPNGHLLSRNWRPTLWANFVAAVLLLVWSFKPGHLENVTLVNIANPFGIVGAGTFLKPLGSVGIFLVLAAAVAGAVSLILRMRRAEGDERQQLKWFLFAGAVFCAVFAVGPILWSLPPSSGTNWIWPALFLAGTGTIPAATGIAMLKYRLYDIDRIINRTLVYGSLTAMLAAIYFGTVGVSQYALRGFTGQKSSIAIVASTLVISALFNPLRRRIQQFIDRLFYRRKYDAAKTLGAFSTKLRDETNIEALSTHLIEAVDETMQPSYVSLWLLEASEGERR